MEPSKLDYNTFTTVNASGEVIFVWSTSENHAEINPTKQFLL